MLTCGVYDGPYSLQSCGCHTVSKWWQLSTLRRNLIPSSSRSNRKDSTTSFKLCLHFESYRCL